MDDHAPAGATLTPEQVATIRRELEIALAEIESLTQLCSIREISSRAEEAIGSALYILDAARPGPRSSQDSPVDRR